MRHAGTQEIETPRLILRRLLSEDANRMYVNWATDPDVTRFLRWEPHKNAAETRHPLPQRGLLPVGHCGKSHRAGVRLHQHL